MIGEIAYFYLTRMRTHPMITRSMKRCENTKAVDIYPSGKCIGGRAFTIKNKQFCSPRCGNQYWGLKRYDDDYWPNYEDGDSCSDWSDHPSDPSDSELEE